MTSDLLASLAGIALSLAFAYVPGLRDWFDGLTTEYKRLVMAGALLIVAAGTLALSCGGVLDPPVVTCDKPGIVGLAQAFVFALVANQAAYGLAVVKRQQDEWDDVPEM